MPKLPKIIEPHELDLRLPRPPFWLVSAFLVLVVLSWLPLVLIARARMTRSELPRVHIFQDMDLQPRVGTQVPSALFPDGRAMREPVPGTVARGELVDDPMYTYGYILVATEDGGFAAEWARRIPERLEVTPQFIRRGQVRYNIYCAPCHGVTGHGDGPIHQTATLRLEPLWVPPSDLLSEAVRERPDGHLFNTITMGIRNMAGYGAQIPVEDRWAIVAYIHALQLAGGATIDDVPEAQRDRLR